MSDQCEEYFNLLSNLLIGCEHHFKVNLEELKEVPQKEEIILENDTFSATKLLAFCVN